MKLEPGFVVGGRYRIERLVAAGESFRIYAASSETNGPGMVAVKVARHEDVTTAAQLGPGRARVEAEWETMMLLHQMATSAVPLPIELVHMYPGDPRVRAVAIQDKQLVRQEPYLVCELADGEPLSTLLRGERLDGERALLLGLRVALLIRAAREVGVELHDFSPSNFVVDSAGENLTLVGVGAWPATGSARANPGRAPVPPAFGKLLAGLLAGVSAPGWETDDADLPRWEGLLASRRVPPEFHKLILGALGYTDAFSSDLEAVENRLRVLARTRRAPTYDHPARSRDVAYLIAPGERIAERFEVVEPLGQGGRGFVYRVRDTRSDCEVLIKCNKYVYDSASDFALELATRRAELEHEYDVLRQFSSRTGMLPQPVALERGVARGAWFDLAPDLAFGEPYLAMEFIKGIPLLDLIADPIMGYEGASNPNNRLPPRLVLRLVAQLAELLSRFHESGFLYQDLKPENVLYDPRAENAYLVDFAGACPRLADGRLDKSHVAFGVQTHGFAAPEFGELWELSDDRFDVYSLGATAYHLLTGVNPERVALEEGSEYPTLESWPLGKVPRVVAELVSDMLAPVEQRIASAAEVKARAERARLLLSRSRPLDVSDVAVGFGEEGAELTWAMPADPRVTTVRVSDANDGETLYDGPPTTRVVTEVPVDEDRSLVVQTGYERRGEVKHSRGRVVEVEAHPPPLVFDVAPHFGGNRVRVRVAPHADEAIVRWSTMAPPLGVEEGEALDLGRARSALHPQPEGTRVHYAAFARYGDTLSAGRFADGTALAPLPAVSELRATQQDGGVSLRWVGADDRLELRATSAAGTRRIALGADATTYVDPAPLGAGSLEYALVAVDGRAESDVLAQVEVSRWPELPHISVVGGPAELTVDCEDADPRIGLLEVAIGTGEPTSLPPSAFPRAFTVEPDVEHRVTVRAIVDDAPGPSLSRHVVVPPDEPIVEVAFVGGVLPLQGEVRLPPGAERWTGDVSLSVTRGEVALLDVRAPVARIVTDGLGVFVDEEAAAGDARRYVLVVRGPDERVLLEVGVDARATEKLAAPALTPLLAAVRVEAIDGVERADVRVGADRVLTNQTLPLDVSVGEGAAVEVAVRRAVAGDPMPWSDAASMMSLARPPAPANVELEEGDDGVVLHWDEVPGAAARYRVRDADDAALVFDGSATRCVDTRVAPGNRYQVVAVRDGLESEPVVAERRSEPETLPAVQQSNVVVLRRPVVRSAGLIVQAVRVGAVNTCELLLPPSPHVVAVVRGDDDAELEEAVRALHAPGWETSRALAALQVTLGRRALVPWTGGAGRVRVLIAEPELSRPDWTVVGDVTPERGELLATGATAEGLRFVGRARASTLSSGDALAVYTADGQRRVKLAGLTEWEDGYVWAGPSGAGSLDLSDALGVGILAAGEPRVLVSERAELGARPRVADLWSDAARGFPMALAQRLEATWQAPVASRHLGAAGTFHFLYRGLHVEMTAGCEVVSNRGRARLHLTVACTHGSAYWTFSMSLSKPRGFPRVIRRVERRVSAFVSREPRAKDLLAGIA